jgi:photosystem II stability/assembly factor-like uncharacterized protein
MQSSSNNLIVANDGGIYYSADGGTTYTSKSNGYNVTQYYSIAIHPTAGSNYMLAGAQDNGTHRLNAAGLTSGVEVTGGDGAFVLLTNWILHIKLPLILILIITYQGMGF